MSLERIHFFLLSLAIRGAGVFFLINAGMMLDRTLEYMAYARPDLTLEMHAEYTLVYAFEFVVKAIIAFYFLLGAPPALRLIQRFPLIPPPHENPHLPAIPRSSGESGR